MEAAPTRTVLAAALLALASPLTAVAVAAPTAPLAAATHTVVASCTAVVCTFDPPAVQAAVGDIVRWTFANACHSVTAGVGNEVEAAEAQAPAGLWLNAFDSGEVCAAEGRPYQQAFTAPGEVPYYCAIGVHRGTMHGVIRVA